MSEIAFDPKRTALLVELMQNDYISPDGVIRKAGMTSNAEKLVPTVRQACQACKAARVPVIGSLLSILTDLDGRAIGMGHIMSTRPIFAREGLRPGTWGHRMSDDLPPPDYTINKWTYSTFYQTELDFVLKALGVNCIVLTGAATDIAIDTMVREGVIRGYQVIVLSDCVTSSSLEKHQASMVTIPTFATVLTSRQFIERLSS